MRLSKTCRGGKTPCHEKGVTEGAIIVLKEGVVANVCSSKSFIIACVSSVILII
jgi:hypothetical protein